MGSGRGGEEALTSALAGLSTGGQTAGHRLSAGLSSRFGLDPDTPPLSGGRSRTASVDGSTAPPARAAAAGGAQ